MHPLSGMVKPRYQDNNSFHSPCAFIRVAVDSPPIPPPVMHFFVLCPPLSGIMVPHPKGTSPWVFRKAR